MEENVDIASLTQKWDEEMAVVTTYEQAARELIAEIRSLQDRFKSASELRANKMRSRRDTLSNSLRLTIKWLIFFGKKLQNSGHLPPESVDSKFINDLMDLTQDVDIDSHIDNFSSFFNSFNVPPSFTSGTSHDNVQEEQSCKTKRRSSVTLVTANNEVIDMQNDDSSSSSEIEIISSVMGSSQLPSTTHSKGKSKKSFASHSSTMTRNCDRADSPLRTTGSVTISRQYSPSNTVPRLNRPSNFSLNQITPHITLYGNKEILLTFPVTPQLVEQSVSWRYDIDQVHVCYQQRKRECSEDRSHSQKRKRNDPPSPAEGSLADSDVIVLESDEIECSAPIPKNRVAAIDPSDIPSCSSTSFSMLEENRSAFTDHCVSPAEICYWYTDDDQGVLASVPMSEIYNSEEVKCPEVISALEALMFVGSDHQVVQVKSNRLKVSLENVTYFEVPIAVDITVNFLCSRTSTPLQKYLATNDRRHMFPLDELCVVRAYSKLKRSVFRVRLEEVLHRAIVRNEKNRTVVQLSTLCRVWAYFMALRKSIYSVRSICYDILKRYTDIAPCLIASIVSIYTAVLDPPIIESEYCIYQAFCCMITSKPRELHDNLWAQATHLISQHLPLDTRPTAEDLIDTSIHNFRAKSSDVEFPELDVKNYVIAIELLTSRFSWPWIYHNVIDRYLVPFIKAFSSTAEIKSCAAVALAYRIIGFLGAGRDENNALRDFVRNIYISLLSRNVNLPSYVFQEACYAIFILETRNKNIPKTHSVFENWAVEKGYLAV